MKVTDYIIAFLIEKGVTDIFGYPGGVICHLLDSITKYDEIRAHINYHEQASAFAACSYAQASGRIGVAYSTSGPGATNLVTGIANAYFDSIPTLFITGQVDTYAVRGSFPVRQRGFQETDIVAVTKSISKYSAFVESPENIKYYLQKAYHIAKNGRPGPVVLDIPADVQRSEVDIDSLKSFKPRMLPGTVEDAIHTINCGLMSSKRPVILAGAAVKQSGLKDKLVHLAEGWNIPVVCSLPAFDTIPYEHKSHMGFIGANGNRYANFVVGKSDLIISIGSRLDLKQVGNERSHFAENAKLIRVDIDKGELLYKVRSDEIPLLCDIKELIPGLIKSIKYRADDEWLAVCHTLRQKLIDIDVEVYHKIITAMSEKVPDFWNLAVDVGQNMLWVAQAFHVKKHQNAFMSSGLGTMGYSLPAAIGAYYATKRPVICFNGDGGLQMNIQELQFIKREGLPIKVVVMNNHALGAIREFQEKNFNRNYYQTTEKAGYQAADFKRTAAAFGLPYYKIKTPDDLGAVDFKAQAPAMIEVCLDMDTYMYPHQARCGHVQDQVPYLEREMYDYLMSL